MQTFVISNKHILSSSMGNCLKLGKAQRETKVGKLHVYLSTAINGSSKQRILKKKEKEKKREQRL